jgi:signal transduction histidine kinase
MPENSRGGDDEAVHVLHRARSTSVAMGLAAGGLAANVAAAALYAEAVPYVGFLDLVRAALPGVTLAAAAVAVAVALLGRGGAGPVVLAAGSLAAAAPALSVGLAQRSAAWVAVGAVGQLETPAVILAALLFPTGRLSGRVRQSVAALVVLLGVAMCLAQALTYDAGGWGWCRCVANPLARLGSGPGGYPELADRSVLVDMAAVVAGLIGFWAAGPRRARGLPAAFTATFTVLAISWLIADVAVLGSAGAAPATVNGTRDATLVLLAVLYAVGFAARRPSRAHVADLLLAVREEVSPRHLQSLVARAIGDPEAVVAWWDTARADFRDHADRLVEAPDNGAVLRVEAQGRTIAVVLADRIDAVESGVRDSVAQALLLAAENRRLTGELRASLEQVRDSRARIVAAGDDARRRIERDLHDGAQQLLISTGIKLNLAAASASSREDPALAGALDEAAAELNRALVELRKLASGIAPTSLAHGDLESALRELVLRSSVPTTVRVTGAGGPDDGTAATAYFVVAECLTNIAKHAGATRCSVTVELGDLLRVTVADDGSGGATLDGAGTGLRGLVDRVEARRGWLELVSGPNGTTVTAAVPARQSSGNPDVVTQ